MRYPKIHEAYLLILQQAAEFKALSIAKSVELEELKAKYWGDTFKGCAAFRKISIPNWIYGLPEISTLVTEQSFNSRHCASLHLKEATEVFEHYVRKAELYEEAIAEAKEMLAPVFQREAKKKV